MGSKEKWQIGPYTLEFDNDTHTYWCDGKKCISVTQLLHHKFPTKYDGISKEILDKAAEKGTMLHESIEIYETYGLTSEDLIEFKNYLFLKKQFKFNVEKCEVPIIIKYNDLTICGRLDQVITEDGKRGLADIKRTSQLDKEYLGYQLNLYRIGYQQCYNEKIELLRGIHLREDKRKYVKIPINEDAVIELLETYKKEEKQND